MKNLFLSFLLAPVLMACATTTVVNKNTDPVQPGKENWVHVFDDHNRIAASVNTVGLEVVYYQPAEVAFKSLFGAMLQQAKAASEAAKKPEEKPKGKK